MTLHLNIPFCLQQCSFCSSAVISGWDSKRMHAYMGALQAEVLANAEQFEDCEVVAVRLDGGTASMAHGEDIVELLKSVRSRYAVREGAPVSMQASISSFSGASMPLFKRAGITRFDLEVMSLDPVAFPRYNKTDALGDFAVVCDYFLHTYANNNLGLILMWGLDEPASPSFRRSIKAAVNTHAVHIILQPCRGEEVLPADAMESQYLQGREMLLDVGFAEYAPCCFSKPGFEDPCLLDRAQAYESLGLGLGAETVFDGIVSTNTSDLACYLANSADYMKITAEVEQLV